MNGFTEIPVADLDPILTRIGEQWMLISATDGERTGVMTASWGGIGIAWGQPVAVCLIRPERLTCTLAERAGRLSLAFLQERYRPALRFCGTHSGREYPDKYAAAGLTALYADGVPLPQEAETVLLCKTLYTGQLCAQRFLRQDLLAAHYAAGGLHRVFVCRIEKVLKKG